MSETTRPSLRQFPGLALGGRADWRIGPPKLANVGSGLALLGPLAMLASVTVPWFAFATAGGAVAFGLFVGAASIVLMAWSFVLALRLRWVEPLFGGLDSVYQAHRWAGSLAVVLMFLHVRVEPVGSGIDHAVGQFAVIKIQRAGLREPHVFTIASSPHEHQLRFFIRDLGDWTAKLHTVDILGADVFVERPVRPVRALRPWQPAYGLDRGWCGNYSLSQRHKRLGCWDHF